MPVTHLCYAAILFWTNGDHSNAVSELDSPFRAYARILLTIQ